MRITNVLRRFRPRANSTNFSFKMGKVFTDAIWRMYGRINSLEKQSFSEVSLAIVKDTLVSVVTRHNKSPFRSSTVIALPCRHQKYIEKGLQ
jgi:hypothetical protein